MWVDQVNEATEFLRYSIPYYFVVLVSIFLVLSPADAAHEFPVYRLQHFDLQGIKYGKENVTDFCRGIFTHLNLHFLVSGSRSAIFNFEARIDEVRLPARKCVIMKINNFNNIRFKELITEGVGAIVIILPADLDSISADLREVNNQNI